MSSNRILLDGQFMRGVTVGSPQTKRPFQRNGDSVSLIISRIRQVRESYYMPGQCGITQHPDKAGAYLMDEADPMPKGIADLLNVPQVFATVPPDQVTYGSRVITKPAPSTVGALIGFWADNTATSSGLQPVLVSSSYLFLNNEVFGPLLTATSANSGADTRITSMAHGIAGTETIVAYRNFAGVSTYRFTTGQYTVVDADTIDLLGINLGTIFSNIAKYRRAYTPGSARVGVRFTQKFYLPGVTVGITTPADIPLPTLLLNDTSFIAAVIANLTGYLTYDADELIRWNDWPIQTQKLQEINMNNV